MRAVARTNVADPADIAGDADARDTARACRAARAGARRALRRRRDGQEFGRRFDTGSCEVASATARRAGAGAGVQRALREAVEWWNGDGPPAGLRGEEIALPARIARVGRRRGALRPHRRRRGRGRGAAAPRRGHPRPGGGRGLRERRGAAAGPGARGRPARAAARGRAGAGRRDRRRGAAAGGGGLRRPRRPQDAVDPRPLERGGPARRRGGASGCASTARPSTGSRSPPCSQDLGRVAVSNTIWEKPGPLTRAEWEQVRMHPYHSERILATSSALEPMARVAGMHHERLDGSGYHRGCRARELPPAARVLAAADAFHAMTQDAPAPAGAQPRAGRRGAQARGARGPARRRRRRGGARGRRARPGRAAATACGRAG